MRPAESGKPWLQDWKHIGGGHVAIPHPAGDPMCPTLTIIENGGDFVAAAPAMARALCEVEWKGFAVDEANVCPARGCRGEEGKHPHSPDCALDQALTAAGLSPQDREEVRRAGR